MKKLDLNSSAAARLVSTIEATGGAVRYPDGTCAPRGDLDWIDLGDAYLVACAELKRRPKIRKARGAE